MFSRLAFPALLASMAILVRADPTPSEPGPGQVFNEGQSCHIAWTPDTTGQWKTMNIELMTGNNWDMIHLTTVTTLDGTSSTASYDFPCPDVTLNAPVYFYQFTSPTAVNRTWTTRFTIASASGQAVPAPNTTQPDGESIGWGVGGLSDPSTATPAPSYLTGSSSSVSTPASTPGAGSSSSAGASSVIPTSATPSGFATQSVSPSSVPTPSTVTNSSSTANSTASGGAQTGGALALKAVSSTALRGGVALAVIAGTFTFVL